MKINCDMGESFGLWKIGQDTEIMPLIDMTNIACGMHASDPLVMHQTVALAKKYGVAIGAHPGYADLQGFGRRAITLPADELQSLFIYQVGALRGICRMQNTDIAYIKPHGALYNKMMDDVFVYENLLIALQKYDSQIPLMIMATPEREQYKKLANQYGISLIFEAFVDRAYAPNGQLEPRSKKGASHKSLDKIKAQALSLIHEQSVTTLDGQKLSVKADSLCIHGDGALALDIAQFLHSELHK